MTTTSHRENSRTASWRYAMGGTILFLALLLIGNYTGNALLSGLAKAAASTCFIAVALTRGAWATRFGKGILAGLVLSWFGDVFLLGRGDALFLTGLTSFLLGHVAYCVAFALHGVRPRWSLVAAAALGPVVAAVLWWLLPHVEGVMRGPVIAYIAVITAMVVLAWGTRGVGGHIAIVIGAMLFFFSDIAVARNRFVAPNSMDWLWGLPLYYAGQLFLAYASGTRVTDTKNVSREAQAH